MPTSGRTRYQILPVFRMSRSICGFDSQDALCTRCSHPLFPNNPTPSSCAITTPPILAHTFSFPRNHWPSSSPHCSRSRGWRLRLKSRLGRRRHGYLGVEEYFQWEGLSRVADGRWQSVFFPTEVASGELRIGVTMGFSYLRSQISASHTSCPMSYSLINLPEHLRYRTANLLLAGIMPRPKEANPDQCQRFLHPLHGVMMTTPKYPQGRLVRVALVCDKPAAHKPGGFGSHSQTNFCTMCWITQSMKASPEAFKENGESIFLPERTDAEHHRLQKEYLESSSLPYFNICEMIVIDPMHNLFLGVVKTHLYHIWVQLNVLRKTKELRTLHALLSKLKLPAHLGRLPSLIGEPAGGSLTADQWLVFCTIVAPLIVRLLLICIDLSHECDADSSALARVHSGRVPTGACSRRAREIAAILEAKRTAAAAARQAPPVGKRVRKPTAKAAAMDIDPDDTAGLDAGANDDSDDDSYGLNPTQQKRRKRQQQQERQSTLTEDEARDNATPPNLHPDDPKNFLKLSSAIKILVARTITEADLTQSDQLMREYCWELVELYGPEVIRPNHHYATHTSRCVRNYGPLHEFWTFLFERLNKVLKSYKTPNHAGGELEASFFREFQRTVQQSRLLGQGAREPVGSELREAVEIMYHATADDRGTVQALARDLDTAQEDGGIDFQLSTRAEKGQLSPELYFCILRHLQIRLPNVKLHSFVEHAPSSDSLMLEPHGILFNDVIVRRSRYLASSRSPHPYTSLIAVRTSAANDAQTWVGELRSIVAIEQPGTKTVHRFGFVRWFRPTTTELGSTVWSQL
ncbi:hypothetical protein B0H13DRAFT_2237002 [Mycena leptocephala]|nr:hypothetical protein B0H13DRAFT_2237002 [Mycena leptocephala]